MRLVQFFFRGVICGGIGGVFAGSLLGLVYALAAGEPYTEGWIVFLWTGAWVGLIIGAVEGAVVGLTLPVTERHLKQLTRVSGVVTVTSISILLSFSVDGALWLRIVAATLTGLLIGLAGATLAFRCYRWLFQ